MLFLPSSCSSVTVPGTPLRGSLPVKYNKWQTGKITALEGSSAQSIVKALNTSPLS